MSDPTSVGLYVDAANIQYNGGWRMSYEVLREYACRDAGVPMRLNTYVTYDAERARHDVGYRNGALRFHNALRDLSYKVIIKEVRRYRDDAGNTYSKANADLDMAVDALLQSDNLGRVVLATGDGDFVRVIQALQNKGCRVEAIAFENVSSALRREVDFFMSGYLIPNLQPIRDNEDAGTWGEEGSTVRGICYHFNREAGYGFMRFLRHARHGLWITDSRREDSPYGSAYFSLADVAEETGNELLGRMDTVFQFRLVASTVKEGQLQAVEVIPV